MRFLLIFTTIFLNLTAHAQNIIYNAHGSSISVTKKTGDYCKYLSIITSISTCPQVVTYLPDFKCNGKTQIPPINFKDELLNIKEMLDTAKIHSTLQLCIFKLEPEKYDDLMLQLVDIFTKSTRWQEHIKTLTKHQHYDRNIVKDELEYYGFLKPLDDMLMQLGFKIGSVHLADTYDYVPKKTLRHMDKDKHLLIPLPHRIEIQLHANKS